VEVVQTLKRRQLRRGRVQLVRHSPVDFVPHMFQLVHMAAPVKMRTLFHCVYALHYHLVFVTKYRRKCINGPMLDLLQDITTQRCKD
jgi:hypothetical protein